MATGLAQAVLAILIVVAPGRRVFAAAAAIALGCLVVWGLSRTAGLPFGPDPARPEPVEVPDLLTGVFEVLPPARHSRLLAPNVSRCTGAGAIL